MSLLLLVINMFLKLDDVWLGLLGYEGDGVSVVALRLRARRNLTVVHCK
jgi:hypothetical protein